MVAVEDSGFKKVPRLARSPALQLSSSFSDSAKWTAVPGCLAQTDKAHVRGRVSTSRDSIRPPCRLRWFSAVLPVADSGARQLAGLKRPTTYGFGQFQRDVRNLTSKR